MQAIRAAMLVGVLLSADPSSAQSSLPVPRLFAPDVVSGPGNDGAPTFSPDGRTLLFERSNGRRAFLLMSERRGGRWGTPRLAPFVEANTSDQQPAFAPDGRYLVYVSAQLRGANDPAGTRNPSRLVMVSRQGASWSPPRVLPDEVNVSARVFKPSVAANGDLYFMSDVGPGAPAPPRWRIFHARRQGEGWARAESVDLPGASQDDVDPCIAPDQSFLIFSSKGRAPRDDGHEHLFIAFHKEDRWGEPIPIRYDGEDWGGDDGEANLGLDGHTLFFTSDRTVPAVNSGRETGPPAIAYGDMLRWNNGNSNVWMLVLADVLRQRPLPQGRP